MFLVRYLLSGAFCFTPLVSTLTTFSRWWWRGIRFKKAGEFVFLFFRCCTLFSTWHRVLRQVWTVRFSQTIDFLQALCTYLDCFLGESNQVQIV